MTRQEFAERAEEARKAEKRFNRLWGVIFFGILIGNWLYLRICDPQMPAAFWALYLVVFFSFLLANVAFTLFMVEKIRRDSGMFCGVCQETLDSNAVSQAIDTGTCGYCSQKFLSD